MDARHGRLNRSMFARPAALLLDFGGVLADAPPRRAAPPELVLRLYNLIRHALPPGEIQRSLTAGAQAWARWRDENHPDELTQAQVWERFVIGDWPRTAQARVRTAIASLSYDWTWRYDWALRPVFLWDRLYLGGGNSRLITPTQLARMGDDVVVVPNTAGILGGVRAWTLGSVG